jgi:ABC-type multidrug transport system ATPase subunit
MGYLGHDTLLYPDLTGEENLKFFGALRGVSADQCHYWLEKVGLLLEAFRKPVRFYSAGMQQRLAIGRLFLHDPEVVLLDEPFNALDQSFINLLMQWLRPKTVLLVTHQLDVGRSLATRVFEVCKSQIFEKPVTG